MDASDCDVASTNWSHWHGIPWQDAHQVGGCRYASRTQSKAGDLAQGQVFVEAPTCPISESAGGQTVIENQGRKTLGIDRQT